MSQSTSQPLPRAPLSRSATAATYRPATAPLFPIFGRDRGRLVLGAELLAGEVIERPVLPERA